LKKPQKTAQHPQKNSRKQQKTSRKLQKTSRNLQESVMFPIQNLKGKASGKNRALRCTCNCAAVNGQRQALSLRLRMGSMGLVIPHTIWLVVWNMNFIFPNSWDDDPI